MEEKRKIRRVVVKSLRGGTFSQTVLVDGVPASTNISRFGVVDDTEYPMDLSSVSDELLLARSSELQTAREAFTENPILNAAVLSVDGANVVPLRKQFGFVAGESFNQQALNNKLKEQGYNGDTLWSEINKPEVNTFLCETSSKMFPEVNPLTNKQDVDTQAFYAPYIPFVSLTNALPSQTDGSGKVYFNPEGKVSVAEFLEALVSLKSVDTEPKHTSMDSVSKETDYFNEGYNRCLSDMSSPFYQLYKRKELMQPLTRFELAYITVLCWKDFIKEFGSVTDGRFDLGVVVKKYRVSGEDKVPSYFLKDYIGTMSITEFKQAVKAGVRGVPFPVFMSLLELDALDLFYFEGKRLDVMREVSRGELAYFLVKTAKAMPLRFVSEGDNTYM